ncbi:MAG TPA: tRNA (adenosine(37)-N6)-threonylcarbamoyltransferase complex dimerization subunit type 1 TsaB [Solirubrobacteraceae bacterium]
MLGFDTATAASAVALQLSDGHSSERRDDPEPGAHPGHATRLLGMAHELLAQAGLSWANLDRIAVGLGPGTFTGLRVGIATARGLAQSLDVDLLGVSSLQALAAGVLRAESGAGEGQRHDCVLAVIDARRGEVFLGGYQREERTAPREILEPRALAPGDIAAAIEHVSMDASAPQRWLAVGDGAVRFRSQLEQAGAEVPPEESPLHRVSAAAICSLARTGAPVVGPLLPDYRRRPDAELALEGSQA